MTLTKPFYHYPVAILAACILCISGAQGQDLTAKLPTDPALVKGTLANGLTYYYHPSHNPGHNVELRLVVKAGSILEDDDQQGLAHFMEHMNFNGTKNFPKNELVSYLQTIGVKFGADVNASTDFDKTVYELSIPTDKPGNLEKGFQVLEDWAHNTLLTDQDIDEERGVVLEESRLAKGAGQRMQEECNNILYANSKYITRRPIGKDSIIAHVPHDALRRFYHDWYRPDLMAVIVIGDIDSTTALDLVHRHFDGLANPAKEREHFFATIPDRTQADALVTKDKEEIKALFYVQYPFKKTGDESTLGYYRNYLKEQLALQLVRLRLRDLFQSGSQIANVGFEGVHGYRSFYIETVFPNQGMEENARAVLRTLRQAQVFGFHPSEIDLVKSNIINAREKTAKESDKKRSADYMSEYIRNFMDNESIEGLANEDKLTKELIPSINNEEISALVQQWMSDENFFTYIMAPDNRQVRLPEDNTLLNVVTSDLRQHVYQNKEREMATTLMDEKPAGGTIVARQPEAGLGATTYTLSNGIKITIKPTDFKNDEIRLSGIKKGGEANYTSDDKINCHFADDLVPMMGYGDFTPSQLTKLLTGKSVSASVSMGSATDEVDAGSNVQNFETMLQLLYLTLTDPRKDEESFLRWKSNYKHQIDGVYANPEIFFEDTFLQAKFNNDPRYVGIPDPGDLKDLHFRRMLEIYRNEFGTANGYHFFISGNIDTATALPLLATYLGSLPVSEDSVLIKDNGLRPVAGINKFTVHNGKDKKSRIQVHYYGEIPYSEALEDHAEVMTDILNIKLMEHLREKMADIYTGQFHELVTKDIYPHYTIYLVLPCGPEHVEELLTAVNKEISDIKQNGPSAEDLQKVKAQWLERHRVNLSNNDVWNSYLQDILYDGKSKDNFLNYQASIEKITTSDIQKTAQLLFDGKNTLTGILLPE